ncbi:MAG: DUF2726 domain-containing protein [Clostridia bacterium]|nr:DUF2726 domain-containing protein [Clostridia bacterium]
MLYIALVLIIIALVLNQIITKKTDTIILKPNNVTNYSKKDYIMTQTELKFYRELKTITDKLQLTIFPQVKLDAIVNTKSNKNTARNRIKSKSIDFAIVNNVNCKIVCCIELDDYTHNYKRRIERDNFVNELFSYIGIKLHRIKVSNTYNSIELENMIKESL